MAGKISALDNQDTDSRIAAAANSMERIENLTEPEEAETLDDYPISDDPDTKMCE